MKKSIVNNHKDYPNKKRSKHCNIDSISNIGLPHHVLSSAQSPQGYEQHIFYQHYQIVGCYLQLCVLLLEVEVAEHVDKGHADTQQYFVLRGQSFILK